MTLVKEAAVHSPLHITRPYLVRNATVISDMSLSCSMHYYYIPIIYKGCRLKELVKTFFEQNTFT